MSFNYICKQNSNHLITYVNKIRHSNYLIKYVNKIRHSNHLITYVNKLRHSNHFWLLHFTFYCYYCLWQERKRSKKRTNRKNSNQKQRQTNIKNRKNSNQKQRQRNIKNRKNSNQKQHGVIPIRKRKPLLLAKLKYKPSYQFGLIRITQIQFRWEQIGLQTHILFCHCI